MAENEKTKKEKPKLPDKPPIVTLTVGLGEGTEITTNESIKKEKLKFQKEPPIKTVNLQSSKTKKKI